MLPQFVRGSPLLESAWAVGILVVFILGAWLILLGMRFAQSRMEKPKAKVLPQLLQSLLRPIFLLVVVEGLDEAVKTFEPLVRV